MNRTAYSSLTQPAHLRDYRFLGTTQSLCPDCRRVVPAKIVSRDRRVYFRKTCAQHGSREDLVCSDERWFDRMEYSLPGRVPQAFAIEPRLGCPYDCGLCTEHEQHTCVAVLEITSNCNLTCPLCYASSAPGGQHVPYDDCCRAIDHLVRAEGRAEVLQLSGGEPTMHPDFVRILDYACRQPIDVVMINTNGIRLAHDHALREQIAAYGRQCEVYLQFDGFADNVHHILRGEPLHELKLRAVDGLGESSARATLVCTVTAGVNLDQVGQIAEFARARSHISGVSFQPATFVGRFVEPADLERRVTFPDILTALVEQTDGFWQLSDFLPVPCAHPNSHTMAYAFRQGSEAIPVTRFMDIGEHLDLLANGITFNRARARDVIAEFLSRSSCGPDCGCGPVMIDLPIADVAAHGVAPDADDARVSRMARDFFQRSLGQDLSSADVFRITTTHFMDPYNFDIRQLMKSCVHHLLPSGHLIPFCAYNNLYRDGLVSLPPLRDACLPCATID